MLCIRTCPFKVHSLVKGREICKLAFTVQCNKGCDRGNEKCLFQGRGQWLQIIDQEADVLAKQELRRQQRMEVLLKKNYGYLVSDLVKKIAHSFNLSLFCSLLY